LACRSGARAAPLQAQTTIEVTIRGGADGLRGGNAAYIALLRSDGTRTVPQLLSNGTGRFAIIRPTFTWSETLDIGQIAGRDPARRGPRPRHPFDGVDKWEIDRIQVRLLTMRTEKNTDRYAATSGG
jgi:hypothetical protein